MCQMKSGGVASLFMKFTMKCDGNWLRLKNEVPMCPRNANRQYFTNPVLHLTIQCLGQITCQQRIW